MLTVRPVDKWLASNAHHKVGLVSTLLRQLVNLCPISPRNATGVGRMYDEFVARAREAVEAHPCGVVIQTEESDAGERLASAFPGTHSGCWRAANVLNISTHRHIKQLPLRVNCSDLKGSSWCAARRRFCADVYLSDRCRKTCGKCS